MQSLSWWIKFYYGERKAHSLVRWLKYFALVWSLALELIPRMGHYIRHSSKSLVLCDEMQAAETEIQRVSSSDSYRCAATASDVGPVDGPFTARCTET